MIINGNQECNYTTIEIDERETENTMGPKSVARIQVNHEDGKVSFLHVAVHINSRGQATGEVSTIRGEKMTRKTVTAVKQDRR